MVGGYVAGPRIQHAHGAVQAAYRWANSSAEYGCNDIKFSVEYSTVSQYAPIICLLSN